MRKGSLRNSCGKLCAAGVVLALACVEAAPARANGAEWLQDLLSREALFHHHRGDDFAAVTQLEAVRDRRLHKRHSANLDLWSVKLKLAYGLYDDADQVLRRLQQADVSQVEVNRAWYELARMLFRKGDVAAAESAIDSMRGEIPEDIASDVQLLRGNVLLALQRYEDASRVLARCQGPRELAGYCHFNRGIAELRAGHPEAAVAALERVLGMPAKDEERLVLRDRAALTLGYLWLQQDELPKAREHFAQVRLEGPYANRALLATGLIEQQKGRTDEALNAWLKLRGRTLADPAVQESYLAVPYALRERELSDAAQQYEQAVAALSRELGTVNATMAAVRRRERLDQWLREARSPGDLDKAQQQGSAVDPEARYLGGLLATREFQETSLGHRDLLAMLSRLDQGLEVMDRLGRAETPPSAGEGERREHGPSAPPGEALGAPHPGAARPGATPESRPQARRGAGRALQWQGAPSPKGASPGIPLLPEIDLPRKGGAPPLPDADRSGLPAAPEVEWLPPAPEWRSPEGAGGEDRLPDAPEVVWLPPASTFLGFPERDRDFAYPDLRPPEPSAGEPGSRSAWRAMPGPADAEPAGTGGASKTLGGLSVALRQTTDRMERLARALAHGSYSDDDLRDRIRALRERARRLRERIAAAIELHERYAKSLILAELEQRQDRLEDYLEQARLELAKTYDLGTEVPR